jgi:hypothetical protein
MTAERFRRKAVAVVLGASAGFALVVAVREARAQTADKLVRDPKRLEIIQQGCKTNQPWATDKLCREAAEAIRRRFRGQGARYTPMKPPAKPDAKAAAKPPHAKKDER